PLSFQVNRTVSFSGPCARAAGAMPIANRIASPPPATIPRSSCVASLICRPSDVDALPLEDERVMLDCNFRHILPQPGSMLPAKPHDAKGRASAAAKKMCKRVLRNDAGGFLRRPQLVRPLQRMRVVAIRVASNKT